MDKMPEIKIPLKVINNNIPSSIIVPVKGSGDPGLGYSDFDPVQFVSDQNVI